MRLRDFIAENNPRAARQISQRLLASVRRLIDQPEMGLDVPGLSGVQDFISGNYVVRYIVIDEEIYILRIWHSKEDR